MCNLTGYLEYLGKLEDYLEFVNTDIDREMLYEPELYAAYGTHNELEIWKIKEWYKDAERDFISPYDADLYLSTLYDIRDEYDLDYYYEREVHTLGRLYECADYWFVKE